MSTFTDVQGVLYTIINSSSLKPLVTISASTTTNISESIKIQTTIINVDKQPIPISTTYTISGFTDPSFFSNCNHIISFDFSLCNINNIPDNCFSNCTSLLLTKLSPNISSIGNNAFNNCTALTLVKLSPNISSIRNNAFNNCTSLSLITFEGAIPTLGSNLLSNTSQIVTINYYSKSQTLSQSEIQTQLKNSFGNNILINILDTEIVPCFHGSAEILCLTDDLKEEYIPIKNLSTEHKVKTYKEGYKKVKYIHSGIVINNPNIYSSCMYKMKKTKNMTDDLIVTGGHSILVDKISEEEKIKQKKYWGNKEYLINDKYLLLSAASNKFKKIEDNKLYMYYHLTLENDSEEKRRFGIWANGILTETMYS